MGLILMGLGIFVIYQGIDLGVGEPGRPGPGFVPLGLGGILTVLSALYLWQILREGGKEGLSPSVAIPYGRTIRAVSALVLYALLVNPPRRSHDPHLPAPRLGCQERLFQQGTLLG